MRHLVTFILPDELVAKYKLSFAASNFSRNLISGGAFDKVYSVIPLNVKEKLPKISESHYELFYSSWRTRLGKMSKFSTFYEQWRIFRKIKNGDSVWFYNISMLNAFLFILLKYLKPNVQRNVIVLDLNVEDKLDRLCLRLINKADGAICLSDSPLFKLKNKALLPGVVPNSKVNHPRLIKINKEFLLSGVIKPIITLTPMVLKAFSMLPDCTLHITGNVVEDEELIKQYANIYPNIKYHGSIPSSEYLDLMHHVTYQLSTRDARYPQNRCNFPSKIIETLLHNRIVISTIQYKQLDGIDYFCVDSSVDEFIKQITSIINKSDTDLLKYANQGNKVSQLFSTDVWNKTIHKIENIRTF